MAEKLSFTELTAPPNTCWSYYYDLPVSATWSPDGNFLAVGVWKSQTTKMKVCLLERVGSSLSYLSSCDVIDAGAGSHICWSPDGNYIAVPSNYSPYAAIIKKTGNTLSLLSALSGLPGSTFVCCWDPTSTYVAFGGTGSAGNRFCVLTHSGDTFSVHSTPSGQPGSEILSLDWSTDGNAIAVGCSNGLYCYGVSGGVFTIGSAASPAPSVNYVRWKPNSSEYFAVAASSSTYCAVYKYSGDAPTKLTYEDIGSAAKCCAWTDNGTRILWVKTASTYLDTSKFASEATTNEDAPSYNPGSAAWLSLTPNEDYAAYFNTYYSSGYIKVTKFQSITHNMTPEGVLATSLPFTSTITGAFIAGALSAQLPILSSIAGAHSVGEIAAPLNIVSSLAGASVAGDLSAPLSFSSVIEGKHGAYGSINLAIPFADAFVGRHGWFGDLAGELSFFPDIVGRHGWFGSLSKTLSLSGEIKGTFANAHFREALSLGDAMAGIPYKILRDFLYFSLNSLWEGKFHETLLDSTTLSDILSFAFAANLTESILFSDSIESLLVWITELEDALTFGMTSAERAEFTEVLVSALILSDLLQGPYRTSIADILDLADASATTAKILTQIVESLLLGDSLGSRLIFWQRLQDGTSLSDAIGWRGIFTQLLADEVLLSGRMVVDGIDYVAWVYNPSNSAFSHYTNYTFNSFAEFGSRAFGFGEDGIFELEGADDAGTDISLLAKTGLMDFGTGNLKNVRHGYLGIASDGSSLLLRTICVKEGRKRKDEYVLRGKAGDVVFEARQNFSNSIQSRYWAFEVENFQGETFDLDSMELGVILFPRKI